MQRAYVQLKAAKSAPPEVAKKLVSSQRKTLAYPAKKYLPGESSGMDILARREKVIVKGQVSKLKNELNTLKTGYARGFAPGQKDIYNRLLDYGDIPHERALLHAKSVPAFSGKSKEKPNFVNEHVQRIFKELGK